MITHSHHGMKMLREDDGGDGLVRYTCGRGSPGVAQGIDMANQDIAASVAQGHGEEVHTIPGPVSTICNHFRIVA